jgi:hypothetical protein
LLGAKFGEHTVKFIQVGVEFEHYRMLEQEQQELDVTHWKVIEL